MIGDHLRSKMVIYGHPKCVDTAKCFQLAAEKGVDVEGKVLDMNNLDAGFSAAALLDMGPALRDVDFTVSGTIAVMSYLDDKGFGPSLVPRNGVMRAKMYEWICLAFRDQSKILEGDTDALTLVLESLEQALGAKRKGDFICGEFCLADVHWSACLNALEIDGKGDKIDSRSNLKAWFEKVKAHPSTSKENIIPFTCLPTRDDIQANTLRDISINV